jgi:segregation and condensation protein A
MSMCLKLKAFEGPLDLLCHLIHVNEIDIYDIPINEITHQYMEYLASLQTFHMEIASEFLVMAATLMEIKSRTLLPVNRKAAEGEGEEPDPRDELVIKLLEYQRYQQAATLFKKCENHAQTLYFKPPEDLGALLQSLGLSDENEFPEIEVAGPESLVKTFQNVMITFLNSQEKQEQKPIPMARESFSIAGQIRQILTALEHENPLRFTAFFLALNHRQKMIITFLSLLELMRTGQVSVTESPKHHDLIILKQDNLEQAAG